MLPATTCFMKDSIYLFYVVGCAGAWGHVGDSAVRERPPPPHRHRAGQDHGRNDRDTRGKSGHSQ